MRGLPKRMTILTDGHNQGDGDRHFGLAESLARRLSSLLPLAVRREPMKIAILGWGSLVWDSRQLPHSGEWHTGGPVLPIEFSRVSKDGRLG